MYAPIEFIKSNMDLLLDTKDDVMKFLNMNKSLNDYLKMYDMDINTNIIKANLVLPLEMYRLKFSGTSKESNDDYINRVELPFAKMLFSSSLNDIIQFYYEGGTRLDRISEIEDEKIRKEELAKGIMTDIKLETFIYQKVFMEQSLDENSSLADVLDRTIFGLMIDEFSKNKQIYQLNDTFSKHLRNTDMKDFVLTEDELNHLPCNTFWVDCSNCEDFDKTVGMVINVSNLNNDKLLGIFNVSYSENTDTYIFHSHYLKLSEINTFLKQNEDNMVRDFEKIVTLDSGKSNEELKKEFENNPLYGNNLIALQLLKYMSMEDKEKDITPNKASASTYKAPKNKDVYKNKFSECQIHDVGFVFGSTFDKYKQKADKIIRERKLNDNEKNGERKSPIPHYVSAHFHRFWCKDENKTPYLKTKWLEPYYTGVDKEDKEKLFTVHKLTNSNIKK